MNEQEWMVSDDPAAMMELLKLESPKDSAIRWCSDRKMRLFACACLATRHEDMGDYYKYAETGDFSKFTKEADYLVGTEPLSAHDWARHWCEFTVMETPTKEQKAAILREIYGNPWKRIEARKRIHGKHLDGDNDTAGSVQTFEAHWLTPTIRQLAEAVHESFGERKCSECCGTGLYDGSHVYGGCPTCHGTGKLPGYDVDTMPILGDALEESGAPEEIVQHVRGKERCLCLGEGVDSGGVTPWGDSITLPCPECRNGWIPLRSPHVRGCWVIDLILGKE